MQSGSQAEGRRPFLAWRDATAFMGRERLSAQISRTSARRAIGLALPRTNICRNAKISLNTSGCLSFRARSPTGVVVAIPFAGGLFVRWGFDLPISVGAVAMSAPTIIVAANAQWLRHLKIRREVANPDAIGLSDIACGEKA